MTIGERIKARRIALGISADELALKLNKNRATIYRYESDEIEKLPASVLESLALALDVTPAYLMGWEDTTPPLPANVIPINKIKRKKVPMLGHIACGEPIFADETRNEYVLADEDIKADFCLTCHGDSMINARINDGDIVFIQQTDMVDDGEIAAVIIEDEATLKRVYYYPVQNKLILNPENPKYAPLVYIGEELDHIRILGRAVAFQSAIR